MRSAPSDADLLEGGSAVRAAVAELNIAIQGAVRLGLRVELEVTYLPEIGQKWEAPIIRSHVSNPS